MHFRDPLHWEKREENFVHFPKKCSFSKMIISYSNLIKNAVNILSISPQKSDFFLSNLSMKLSFSKKNFFWGKWTKFSSRFSQCRGSRKCILLYVGVLKHGYCMLFRGLSYLYFGGGLGFLQFWPLKISLTTWICLYNPVSRLKKGPNPSSRLGLPPHIWTHM